MRNFGKHQLCKHYHHFLLNTIKTKLIFLFYYAFGHISLYRIPNFSFGVFQPRIWLCQKARILVTKRGPGCPSLAVTLGLTSGPEQQRGPPAHEIRESFSIFRWESTKAPLCFPNPFPHKGGTASESDLPNHTPE